MSTKQMQEDLTHVLKQWQHLETETVAQTAAIIDRTQNPLIRLVMEIIQRDSAMHHRVQQFIIDSFESRPVTITPDDLAQVWDAIEEHIAAEKKTGELLQTARKALAGTKNVVQDYLLSYLGRDEEKHDHMLDNLDLIKRGLFKSA